MRVNGRQNQRENELAELLERKISSTFIIDDAELPIGRLIDGIEIK